MGKVWKSKKIDYYSDIDLKYRHAELGKAQSQVVFEQAGAEFGQAQQLVSQIWGLFGFCCQRPDKS